MYVILLVNFISSSLALLPRLALINKNCNVGKLLWYKRNKTLQDSLLWERNQVQGEEFSCKSMSRSVLLVFMW